MKTKPIIIVLILLTLFAIIHATNVSGDISGTWTKANSPYNVVGEIVVPQGQSLYIQSGVSVIFQGNYGLTVQGYISANGTVRDTIRFTGNQNWKSIRLENENISSYFLHTTITEATTAIQSINSPFEISLSRIANIEETGINIHGIGNPAKIDILYTKFQEINRSAIQITENSNVIIRRNIIVRCGLGPQYMGAIHLSNQSANGENNPQIISNIIRNNNKQGITTWDITNNSRVNPVIYSNIIENNLTGIYLLHSSGTVSSNIIRNNYIEGDSNSGAGIMVSGASASPRIFNNTITGNYTGFFIVDNASPDISMHTNHLGANIIMNNIDASGTDWSIYLFNSANDINATGNLFTTNNPADIAASIFDKSNNTNLGNVDISGFLEMGVIQGSIKQNSVGMLVPETEKMLNASTIIPDDSVYLSAYFPLEIFSQIIQPGDYVFFMNGFESSNIYGVYGGYEEPTIVRVNANQIISDINIFQEQDHPLNHPKIVTSSIHNIDTIPVSFYNTSHIWKYDTFFLSQDDDFIFTYGHRKINYEENIWEDSFFEEPIPFLKINNINIGDVWDVPFSENNEKYVVRNISDRVQIDRIKIVDSKEIILERMYLQSGIGIVEIKRYFSSIEPFYTYVYCRDYIIQPEPVPEPEFDLDDRYYFPRAFKKSIINYENTLRLSNHQLINELHSFPDNESLFPLFPNQTINYTYQYIPHSSTPTNFNILSNGYLMWDPPTDPTPITGYRIYADGILYASVDSSQIHYTVDTLDLYGNWYVTALFAGGSESGPSNSVVTDKGVVLPITIFSVRSYPNPFYLYREDDLNFRIQLFQEDEVTIDIYNIRGQKVYELYYGMAESRELLINVSSRNLSKLNLASGAYFYRIKAGEHTVIRRMTIIK